MIDVAEMRLIEELADDRYPLGVGKLQFAESPLLCGCGHTAGVHFEMWPAYQRVTGDASYPYVMPSPIREGCDQCVDCGGLRINMDEQ